MLDFIKINTKYLVSKFGYIAGAIFGGLSICLSFLSWDEIGLKAVGHKLLVCGAILVLSAIAAIVWALAKYKVVLWKQGDKAIQVWYADLFCFLHKKNEKIIVIPVNTHFDTIVGDGVVSPRSIHGKWIERLQKEKGLSLPDLDGMILSSLKGQKVEPFRIQDEQEKPKGKREEYQQGTIAVIDDGKTRYYLLALARFNEKLNAHCSKDELIDVIDALITFYNENGQGFPIYIPLLGSGLSRTGLSPEECLQIITDLLKLRRDRIQGEANVVVYSKQKNEVSILEL